jgi:adenine-specific DNA-methyltransferase
MLYPRLRLAKNLLSDDGIIMISIDDHELAQLRNLCDEIFGGGNFIENLVWKRRYGGGAKEKHIVSIHEYILMYSKNLAAIPDIFVELSSDQVERYYKLKDQNFDKFGPYRLQPLEPAASMADRPNLRFPVIAPDGTEVWPSRQWLWGKDKFAEARAAGLLDFAKRENGWQIQRKQYLRDPDGEQRKTKTTSIIDGLYGQGASAELGELFGDKNIFPFPKPAALIKHLLSIVGSEGILLDFFAGSGSSAQAVFNYNIENSGRWRFIQVQIPEKCDPSSAAFKLGYLTISDVAKERIRRAGKAVVKNESLLNVDVGFRVLEVDASNMENVYYSPDALKQADLLRYSNIKPDRTSEDLLFQVMLDWGVDLGLPISYELIAGKKVFFVDGNALAACFDTDISEELVTALAKRRLHDLPLLKVVFRDAGYASDSAKINVEQIFKLLSPTTELRTL